jgi:hypothetical protein
MRLRRAWCAPCPVCNRPDGGTIPEMPDGFVVDIKREDWD